MSKYRSGMGIVPTKSADKVDSDWADYVSEYLEKSAVKSKQVDDSMFNQISSIVNRKSKYMSVADAVRDMQERSGFASYAKKLEAEKNHNNKKQASSIKIFEVCPQVKHTIENCITDTKGNLSIPAIIERVKSIHNKDVNDSKLWDAEDFITYVAEQNSSVKSKFEQPNADNGSLGKNHQFSDEDFHMNESFMANFEPNTR